MKMSSLVLHKFYSYLLQNLAMLLLLCLVITPVGFFYHSNEVRAALTREQELLDSSVRQLNDQLITMESLLTNLCSSAQLKLLSVQSTIESKNRLALNNLYGNLGALCSTNDLLTEIVILFDNSETVVTSKGPFTTLSTSSGVERFLDFYNLENPAAAYFTVKSDKNTHLVCLDGMTLDVPQVFSVPQEIAFVYSMNIGTETRAFVFVSQEGLNRLFNHLLGSVQICDYLDRPIASITNGLYEDPSGGSVLSSPVYTRVSGVLNVNSSALQQVVSSTMTTILMFALALILFSLFLATFSAYRLVKPIRQVVNALTDCGFQPRSHSDTFNYFLSCVKNLHSQHQSNTLEISSLQQRLEQNIIERYLFTPSNLLSSADDLPDVKHFPQRYVLGYATLCTQQEIAREDRQQELQMLTSMVAANLSAELDAIHVPLYQSSFVLIIPADSDCDPQLARLERMINTVSDTVSIPISMIVSSVFVGLSQLNAAFELTRSHVFENARTSGLHYIRPEIPSASPDVSMQPTDSVHLFEAVSEGNYPRASELIGCMMTTSYDFAALEQRYYYVRMALLQAQHSLQASELIVPPAYSTHYSPDRLLQHLNDFAQALCAFVCRQRVIQNQSESQERQTEASNQIIQYINENFACDTLSPQSICIACGIGSRTLNDVCRKATGMNVAAYIQQLRMDKAASMLRNTDVKVDDILRECGYTTPNTFYKAFKRIYDKSPSEYRSSFR